MDGFYDLSFNLESLQTNHAFNGDPILYVYHNQDGDWQFHTTLQPNEEDSIWYA